MEKILKELKKFGIKNDIPNISETNAKFLRDLIRIKKVENLLEIGTANWYSTINFAFELKKTWGKLTTIEFSARSYGMAIENFKEAWVDDIINAVNANALDYIPKIKEKFDFVFIDGMKRRTKDFLELTWDKVEKDWIIIIDDVIKFSEKMVWLNDFLEKNNIKHNIIPIDVDDGIMMIMKD